ncbi:MAG TPA: NAD(P)-dependent oxidoreductase [Tepidiformaceae bacterium]|nr:NAD(P)-dependent oxidoreductase [Tepidiformaceae bacterium]
MRIFVAGASGVVGRPLLHLLVSDGHEVNGTTRSASKQADIRALGATAVVVDAFDRAALVAAAVAARPEVVIHQLTDLPDVLDPTVMPAALAANSRLRIEGTANLVAAAKAAGARRLIAQSIAFVYVAGTPPYRESDPIEPTADGVISLENAVLGGGGIEGIVLRYGRFYGPGTWTDAPAGPGSIHAEAAAEAARLAVTRGAPGIYNIAEDDGAVDISKARRDLGFDPGFRLGGV